MAFQLPVYTGPDFASAELRNAPSVRFLPCPSDGVPPECYHSTSMYPEYVHLGDAWQLLTESRMDSQIVLGSDGTLRVVEMRNLHAGDLCAVGRSEDGSEGILVWANGFSAPADGERDSFFFRQNRSRETAYSRDYDRLTELLRYEKQHGRILWVLGPAFSFDAGARAAMQAMIENGYAHGILAGNALATHDLEGAFFHTALGQDIYTQQSIPNGHYHHMDVIRLVRASGSIPAFIERHGIQDGIMYAAVKTGTPFVLTGSIRDDGPLPEVITDSGIGADRMRGLIRSATTVICLATMLHTIAAGNMTPSYTVTAEGTVRPVYLYCVDSSEFVANKLIDRGSLSAVTMVANVQDFIRRVVSGLDITC